MNYCPNCGNEVKPGGDVCLSCGKVLHKAQTKDSGNSGLGVLGFFFPLIGFILYFLWKDDQPNNSKMAGKGALIGVIANIVFGIIWVFLVATVLDHPYFFF